MHSQYLSVIKKPMDLQTLKANLDAHVYNDVREFYSDFRLIFENAITFNSVSFPLLASISRYMLKKLEKEYKNRFEKSSSSSFRIAYLYSQYLQILGEKAQTSKVELVDFYQIGKTFAEPSLTILAEKLNSISTKENFGELCEILGKNPKDPNLSVEIAELSKEQRDKLCEFVKKYDKKQ